MKFRLLDSQKRPLVFGQNRQDSSDQSEDSVLDEHSETLNGVNGNIKYITVDVDKSANGDIENSKWEINGETDNISDLNDDSVNLTVDSNTNNSDDKGKFDELFDESLADIENSGEPKSRRWTADSGITSRGSSFSSEPDINIDHESVLEMQKYLHGKADAIFEPYENEKLKETDTEDFKKVKTKLVSEKPFSEKVIDQQSEFRTKELTEENDFLDNKNIRNIKMENENVAVLAYEAYQEDDFGHHFCTSKHNHVDNKEPDVNWERVDDHEASVLAGKYLFAHGKDVEADEAIQPLSEWELIKQTDGSQLISADKHDEKRLMGNEIGQLIAQSRVESAGKTLIKESETELINSESYELSVKHSDIKHERIIENKEELFEAKKRQTQFSADVQDIEVTETDKEVISTKVTGSETVTETVLNEVTEVTKTSVLTSHEQNGVKQIETETNVQTKKLDNSKSKISGEHDSSTEEYFGSSDDENLYDLDVDRSEQIMQKRSQQYRRASAQDSVTSEMAEQMSAKQALSIQSDTVTLESETKTEICAKGTGNVDTCEKDSKNKTESEKSEIDTESEIDVNGKMVVEIDSVVSQELNTSTDDDSYDLDLDRSEQIIATRSQQIRRLSAQDNLTKEKVDQISAKQNLITSDKSVSLEAETKQIASKSEVTNTDNELVLDKDREENTNQFGETSKEPKQEKSVERKDLTDENLQGIQTEVSTETTETVTPCSNEVSSKVETDELSLQAAKEQNLCEASVEIAILYTHEAGLDIVEVESLSVQAKDKEKQQTTAFDKLSLAEKNAILKQISDISLAKGRRLRGKAEKGNSDAEAEVEDGTAANLKADTENLSNNDDAVVMSDVKEAEKPLVKVDRQLSLTGETVVKQDKTDAELLKDQEGIDHVTTSVQIASSPDVLDASSSKNLFKDSELNLDHENKQGTCTTLEILDTKVIEKIAEGNEDNVSFAKIENAKSPMQTLYQAEATPGEKGLHSPVRKASLEMLEDTKPAVPNIINFADDLKSKTEIEYKVEEAINTAHELTNDINLDSAKPKVSDEDLKEADAVISKEQIGVITERLEISNAEIITDSKAAIADTVAGKKTDSSENSEMSQEIEVTPSVGVEQTSVIPDADANITTQDLKSGIAPGSEPGHVDDKDSKEAVAAISEEQIGVITETDAVEISTVETVKESKAATADADAEKKTDDSDMSKTSQEIGDKPNVDVEQPFIKPDAVSILTAQDLKSGIAPSSEPEHVDDIDSKEAVTAISKEQIGVITETDTVEIPTVEIVKDGKAATADTDAGKKTDDAELSEISQEIEVTSSRGAEQTSVKPDAGANITTQDLKSGIAPGSEPEHVDDKDSKEAVTAISEEQIGVITETDAVEISTVESVKDSKAATADTDAGKKTDDSDMSKTSPKIEETPNGDVEQPFIKKDADSILTAQGLKGDITFSSELEQFDNKDSKEAVAVISMEQSGALPDAVPISTVENVIESNSACLDAEAEKKVDRSEVSELPQAIDTAVCNVEQETIKRDTGAILESKVGEIEAEQTTQLSIESSVAGKHAEKLENLLAEKPQNAEVETVDTDVVDAGASTREHLVTKISEPKPEAIKIMDEDVKTMSQEEITKIKDTKEISLSDEEHGGYDAQQEGAKEDSVQIDDKQISKTDEIEIKVEPVAINEGEAVTLRWQILGMYTIYILS